VAEYDLQETVHVLLRAAADPDESVRSAAVGFLANRSGVAATQALVSLLGDPSLRERVVSALALPADGRIPGLLTALEAADEGVAPLLVAALARMQRADARAALLTALGSSSPAGRRAAAAAVAALGTVEAHQALEQASSHDADPEVRRACLLALSR
jgi:HEAT repeat protein